MGSADHEKQDKVKNTSTLTSVAKSFSYGASCIYLRGSACKIRVISRFLHDGAVDTVQLVAGYSLNK